MRGTCKYNDDPTRNSTGHRQSPPAALRADADAANSGANDLTNPNPQRAKRTPEQGLNCLTETLSGPHWRSGVARLATLRRARNFANRLTKPNTERIKPNPEQEINCLTEIISHSRRLSPPVPHLDWCSPGGNANRVPSLTPPPLALSAANGTFRANLLLDCTHKLRQVNLAHS
jgi:hypothetical protein